jgi:hypothetical protein
MQLERLLVRRVKKAEREFGESMALADANARIVARLADAASLDDRRRAVARTFSLRRSGPRRASSARSSKPGASRPRWWTR